MVACFKLTAMVGNRDTDKRRIQAGVNAQVLWHVCHMRPQSMQKTPCSLRKA